MVTAVELVRRAVGGSDYTDTSYNELLTSERSAATLDPWTRFGGVKNSAGATLLLNEGSEGLTH